MINKKEGVEIYYQPGRQNMVVYDRAAKELAIGNAQGEIQTLFRPDPEYIEKEVIKGTMIRINAV